MDSARYSKILSLAKNVLEIEAKAILGLKDQLDLHYLHAVELILNLKPNARVVVTGVGKSGHIAKKIASTLSSTGTPSLFVHPSEAGHGDLGMVTPDDCVLALSNSGESEELIRVLPGLKRHSSALIVMTGNPNSTLAKAADIHLSTPVEREACPLGLAPTASTTAMLALGDALAVTLLDLRNFSHDDFARTHPSGSIGRRLLTYVRDIMVTGDKVPKVLSETIIPDALLEISQRGMGMTAVVDGSQHVIGILTDGDLRRALDRNIDLRIAKVDELMTKRPRLVMEDILAVDALNILERYKITSLLVVDSHQRLVGALHLHDILKAGII